MRISDWSSDVCSSDLVVSFNRTRPQGDIANVAYQVGDVLNDAFLASAFEGADIVISALSPRGALEGEGKLRAVLAKAANLAAERGIRFGVIGGAGSLLVAPVGPRYVDTAEFPAIAVAEAREMAGVLDVLRASPQALDWFQIGRAHV